MADFSGIEEILREATEEASTREKETKEVTPAAGAAEAAAAAGEKKEEEKNERKMIHINDHERWHQRTMECFKQLWEEKTCLDFTIRIGERTIGAHRLILSLFSNFFYDYFHKEETRGRLEVTLDHLNYAAVERVIKCVYVGEMQVEPENMKETLKAIRALRLNDQYLQVQVSDYISENPGIVVKKRQEKPLTFSRKM